MGRAAELDEHTQRERDRRCCKRLLADLWKAFPNGPPADVAVGPARAGVVNVAPAEASSGCSSSFAWL